MTFHRDPSIITLVTYGVKQSGGEEKGRENRCHRRRLVEKDDRKERKRAIVSRSFSRTLTVKLQCAFIRDRFNSATVFLPPIPRREIINFRRDSS